MMIHEKNVESSEAYRPVESGFRGPAEVSERTGENASGLQSKAAERTAEAPRLDREAVEKIVEQTRKKFSDNGVELKFNVDGEEGSVQVEVREAQSDKVIRKIPADEVVQLSKSIKEMAGKLLDRPI